MAQAKYEKWLEKDNLILLEAWARDGLTDEQISKNIGIRRSTLYDWKKKYQTISDALKKGKEIIDIEVENALCKRALGYEYQEEEIYIEEVDGKVKKRKKIIKKVMPPDTTAQIFWLKNRKPEHWRDKRYTKEIQDMFNEKTEAETEKLKIETEKTKVEIDKLKGLGEEIEDLTEVENEIYGED